jgi:uncharacterized protein (DUF433 family)
MSAVADILNQISALSPAEQAEVRDKLPTVAGRPVIKTPDTCGGDARIDGTRIMVWLLEAYRRDGVGEAELLDWYPTLGPGDLRSAWAYADDNRAEMDAAIADNEAEPSADEFDRVNEYTWVHKLRHGRS